MKSAQMGAAVTPPARPKSRLSSNPIQITQTRLEVKPANQPSREVPVLPAAGSEKPRARTPAAVPRLSTSLSKLVTRKVTRGSSTALVCGVFCSSVAPLAPITEVMNKGSARVPPSAKAV